MAQRTRGGPGRRVVSPAMVGRGTELDRVAQAVAAPPALVVVDGEAGIGKTRLLRELAERPELAGRQLLVGRCHRIRESFPLGPVIEAVRGLDRQLVAVNLSPVTGALRPLLPEIADRLPPAPEPLGDRAAERHRVFRALLAVLTSVGPVVLALEDLHWVDEQTADFVGYLLSEAPPQLAVVLTLRSEDVEPRTRALTATRSAPVTRTDVQLRSLDATETGALAAAIVGADRVSGEFAGYLRERTSGVPFAIEELLALLQARGSLARRGGRWARRTLDELDVPSSIRDSVLERVGRLSAPGRAVAEAAAVLQLPVPVEILVATCRPGVPARPGVEAALESGLLVEDATSADRAGGRAGGDRAGAGVAVGFRHLLAAQAVYEEIPGPRRRELHGRAADALAAAEPVPLGQYAHHLRQAGRLAEWVGAAERAAEQALRLGHDGEAFRLLEEVLRHAPLDPDRRGRLAVRLGQAAIEALRAQDVVGLLSEVLEQELPARVRAQLRFQVGMLLHEVGDDPLRMRRLLAGAAEELRDRPDLRAWAMVALGIPTVDSVPLAEYRAWLRRALEIIPTVPDRSFEVFLLGKAAMLLTPAGDPLWRTVIERIEQLTGGAPAGRRELNAYWSVGTEACYAGHYQTAQRLLSTGLAGAVAGENRRLELGLRSALAMLRYCTGEWEGLDAEAEALAEQLTGSPRGRIDAQAVASCLALVRGDIAVAAGRLPEVVALIERIGGFDLLPFPLAALIRLRLARQELPAAAAAADRLAAAVASKGVWPPGVRALPVMVEALVAAGRVADATGLVDRCAAAVHELDAPIAAAALPHAEGILLRAVGDHPAAAARSVAAAEAYQQRGCRYEAALALEQAAGCRFAAGEPEPAQAALQAAVAEFRVLDAAWDAGRAIRTARRHGVPVPARHRGGRRGYGRALSPREREVAELAATGRSNKEIAAALYLSVNTVARHVAAAMRKLEARSRAALAHRLAGLPEERG